jgi:F0F1-type ATP synthase membrane subunit b/b'
MAKWKLPEGRKPLTNDDMAALTHRLADTAIEQSELYQAAKRDAEEAEAYAAELEAKLAKMQRSRDRYREAWEAEKTRTTLAELKGQDDE